MDRAELQRRLRSLCQEMVDLLKQGLERAAVAHSSAAGSAHPLGAALVASDAEICGGIEPLFDQAAGLAEELGYKRPPIVRAGLGAVSKRLDTYPTLTPELGCEVEDRNGWRAVQGFVVFGPDDGRPTFVWTDWTLKGEEPGRLPVQRCSHGQAVERIIGGLTAWVVALEPAAREPRSDKRTGGQVPRRVDRAWRQYQTAVTRGNLGSKATDREVYNWCLVQLSDIDDMPKFPTWQRYVREGRRLHGVQKNLPRAGRSHGSSVVRREDIETSTEDGG